MAAVNVRICSHCLHFETVCSLCFWGCHWHKIKPNPAAMTNITKWMWKDFPRGSIKSTSGDLALCANSQSSIFTVSPRCLQRWQVESAAFVWLSFLLLGSQGQPDDWGGIALGEPEGPPDKKLHSEGNIAGEFTQNNVMSCQDAALSHKQCGWSGYSLITQRVK